MHTLTRRLIILTILLAIVLPLVTLAGTDRPSLNNPLRCQDIRCLALTIIRYFLGLLAIFATFVFIYGGFLMLTSAGEADRVKKAKETLFWASLGIVTVLGSWVFIRTVLEAVTAR